MKKSHLIVFILVLLVISACRSARPLINTSNATAESQEPANSPLSPVSPIGEDRQDPGNPSPSPFSPTEQPIDDEQQPADGTFLPKPALFDTAWDDRSLFQQGLNEGELEILSELPGATVYHLLLKIEDPTTVNGQMEMMVSNQETVVLDELYFHLFADQLGGSIEISNVTVNDQPVQPVREGTALRVPLSDPLNPGEEIVIAMDFVTTVPQGESTKYNILANDEDILALAHFYPMIAVFDDEGWHIEASPPHGDETYADMSFYLVQVTAPSEQTIVTSGTELERFESDNSQIVTLAAGPVRDFYLVMSERFGVVSNDVGPVRINSYAPQEFLAGAELALDTASEALDSYEQRFGPYPYSELDIVSTPTLALGIEYPGIFANALRIYDLEQTTSSGTPNAIYLESTTAHEAGHQWFYNLVGNDQLNEPWLDEALTQYATWTYYIDRYGQENAQGYYDSLEGRWSRIDFAEIPIGLPADQYSGSEYGAVVYGRGPIFLNELAGTIGQETFDQFMRDYVDQFRWKIATSEDFQALAEDHCGCDLSQLFDAWVYPQ